MSANLANKLKPYYSLHYNIWKQAATDKYQRFGHNINFKDFLQVSAQKKWNN